MFRRVAPDRVQQVDALIRKFDGLLECMWLILCEFYNEPTFVEVLPLPLNPKGDYVKWRLARLMLFCCPHRINLFQDELNTIRELDDPEMYFGQLRKLYGAEPLPHEILGYLERLIVTCLMHDRHDLISKVKLKFGQSSVEKSAFAELLPQIGEEVTWEDVADRSEPYLRLQRIFQKYDPQYLPDVPRILGKRNGMGLVELFASLQRCYGPEPSLDATELGEEHRQDAHQPDAAQEPDSRKKKKDKKSSKLNRKEAAHLRTLTQQGVFLMPLLAVKHKRPEMLERARQLIVDSVGAESPPEAVVLDITRKIVRFYDRSMLYVVDALVAERYAGTIEEAGEWLQLLDCCYANAEPPSSEPSLRTIVSLQHRKYGSGVYELEVSGGVENFLRAIDPRHEQEVANRMLLTHGRATEEELASHFRRRLFFHHYMQHVPADQINGFVQAILRDNPNRNWHDLFKEKFGPEPAPLPVDVDRVKDILRRFVPHKLRMWETIVDAHADVGDTTESVIRNIAQTYGPERSPLDSEIENKILAAELETRFKIFAEEVRMRDVLVRRVGASINDSGAAPDAAAAAVVSEERKAAIARQIAESEKKREKEAAILLTAPTEAHVNSESGEAIPEVVERPLPDWGMHEPNINVEELFGRFKLEEASEAGLRDIRRLLSSEDEDLNRFLKERTLWRKKWERDEEIRLAILERRDLDAQAEARRQALIAASEGKAKEKKQNVSYSLRHQEELGEMFKELNDRVVRNLEFEVEVNNQRARFAKLKAKGGKVSGGLVVPITVAHKPHEGCVFHDPNQYACALARRAVPGEAIPQRPNPYVGLAPLAQLEKPDDAAKDKDEGRVISVEVIDEASVHLLEQLQHYLHQLFEQYDPKNIGRERDLLRLFEGNEAKLVSALERQYNIDHWVEHSLYSRVLQYYRKMAPEYIEEAPVVVQRFVGREEAMWSYLRDRYGPVPSLLSGSMQAYLKDRLLRYLATRAPHLVGEIDKMIVDLGDANGEHLMRSLTATYGPEDPQVRLDALTRKLRQFYTKRGIRPDNVNVIAKRFLGHEDTLNRMLSERFGASLEGQMPDVSDVAASRSRPTVQGTRQGGKR